MSPGRAGLTPAAAAFYSPLMQHVRPAWDFRVSLAFSAAVHALLVAWILLHQPHVIEVSLPGTYSVDLVNPGSEATVQTPPEKLVANPPVPVKRDEVTTSRRKPREHEKPTPMPPARPSAPQGPPAPAAPEARIGMSGAPGVAADFPFSYYLVSVRNAIGRNWIEPGVTRRTRTTIFFRIRRDGTVDDARVEVPSGVQPFDQAALRAVLASSPLPRLPADFKTDQLGVHFDFEVTR